MSYVFCNRCGHRNPPESRFCSACGTVLDRHEEHTITLAKVDPLQDAPGTQDNVSVDLAAIGEGEAILVLRDGAEEGTCFSLRRGTTSIGRHPDSGIVLDDITVSRRHAEILLEAGVCTVIDAGSLNGTYVNQDRVESVTLTHGDDLQIGRFRLVFFLRPESP